MKIVILSTQRSGSTLVCDDFAGTGKLGIPTEHFLKFDNNEKRNLNYIQTYLAKNATTNNGVEAVKIMANQLDAINQLYKECGVTPYRKPWYRNKKNNPYKYLFETFKDAVFFRVYRQDKVAQAVSLYFSERTDVFHLVENSKNMQNIVGKETEDTTIRNVSFEYDKNEIDSRLRYIQKNEDLLDAFCDAYNIKTYLINYEEITSNNDYIKKIGDYIKKIGDYAGIENLKPGKRRLKKIGGANAQQWIDRYKSETKNR
jgi:LPS sulfotransferase NodH